jgi:hypothetical protein
MGPQCERIVGFDAGYFQQELVAQLDGLFPRERRNAVKRGSHPLVNGMTNPLLRTPASSSDWMRKSISGSSNPIASISKSSAKVDNSLSWTAAFSSSQVDLSLSLIVRKSVGSCLDLTEVIKEDDGDLRAA